ncbi:MAG: hypothetical protein WA364_24320 [Candidatus Nitrosopolaris sp.]
MKLEPRKSFRRPHFVNIFLQLRRENIAIRWAASETDSRPADGFNNIYCKQIPSQMHKPATLRFYQNIGGIEKELASVQQQLTMLNIFAVNKQQALMTLLRLQRLGVKEDEIYGLSKILDLSRLGKE